MYEIYCELRDEKGYKDADIARITGITKSTFSDWKSGRSTPKQDKLQKIADCFNVSLEYLMMGEEKENTNQSTPELSNVYFSLAKEAQQNGIDPRDIKMAIEMLRKIREEEKNK